MGIGILLFENSTNIDFNRALGTTKIYYSNPNSVESKPSDRRSTYLHKIIGLVSFTRTKFPSRYTLLVYAGVTPTSTYTSLTYHLSIEHCSTHLLQNGVRFHILLLIGVVLNLIPLS